MAPIAWIFLLTRIVEFLALFLIFGGISAAITREIHLYKKNGTLLTFRNLSSITALLFLSLIAGDIVILYALSSRIISIVPVGMMALGVLGFIVAAGQIGSAGGLIASLVLFIRTLWNDQNTGN